MFSHVLEVFLNGNYCSGILRKLNKWRKLGDKQEVLNIYRERSTPRLVAYDRGDNGLHASSQFYGNITAEVAAKSAPGRTRSPHNPTEGLWISSRTHRYSRLIGPGGEERAGPFVCHTTLASVDKYNTKTQLFHSFKAGSWFRVCARYSTLLARAACRDLPYLWRGLWSKC